MRLSLPRRYKPSLAKGEEAIWRSRNGANDTSADLDAGYGKYRELRHLRLVDLGVAEDEGAALDVGADENVIVLQLAGKLETFEYGVISERILRMHLLLPPKTLFLPALGLNWSELPGNPSSEDPFHNNLHYDSSSLYSLKRLACTLSRQ